MSTLYVSDLDGTLLNTDAELSDKSKKIINNLVQRGMKFSYATARSFSSASKILQGLDLSIPAITYNGAFFIEPTDGKILYSTCFSAQQISYASAVFIKNKISPLVYALLDRKERVSWIAGNENDGMRHYLQLRATDKRLSVALDRAALYGGSIFYFTVIGAKNELEALKGYFTDKTQFVCTLQQEIYRPNEYWLEIMPHNATKAMGVQRLKESTGCDKVVCFGDALNDISMFTIADEAYAVANAHLALKEKSTAIIGSNNDDGVALWLQTHVE